MKWIITENEACKCDGLTVDVLPDKIPTKLRVLAKEQHLSLEADGLAGIIPCKKGNSIVIEPKCKTLHPFSMYEYVNHLFSSGNTNAVLDPSIMEINLESLAQVYANELINIQRQPKMIKRLPTSIASKSVKGRVNWVKTAHRLSLFSETPIVATIRESTHDIPENQVLSMAANICLTLFDKHTKEWRVLKSWCDIKYSSAISKETLKRIRSQLSGSTLSGAHAYYRNALALSFIILGVDQSGLMDNEEHAILFNMPGLYEDYIRTAFMRMSTKKGYSCQKSFTPRSFMFSDGSCELEPDITIYDGNKPLAILDVKYKVPDSKDYYQIFTYMKYAELSEAYVVSPYVKDGAVLNAYDGSKIISIRISESNNVALEDAASQLIDQL